MNGAFVKTHLSFFVCFCFFALQILFFSILSHYLFIYLAHVYYSHFRPLVLSPPSLQPSSPGDYYSSVESDLKVELTEKLFALDTEGDGSPEDTEVRTGATLKQKVMPIDCMEEMDVTYVMSPIGLWTAARKSIVSNLGSAILKISGACWEK